MFDIIIYFEKIALFASNFKDFFYIFIVVVYANTNALDIVILKFVNITFE